MSSEYQSTEGADVHGSLDGAIMRQIRFKFPCRSSSRGCCFNISCREAGSECLEMAWNYLRLQHLLPSSSTVLSQCFGLQQPSMAFFALPFGFSGVFVHVVVLSGTKPQGLGSL